MSKQEEGSVLPKYYYEGEASKVTYEPNMAHEDDQAIGWDNCNEIHWWDKPPEVGGWGNNNHDPTLRRPDGVGIEGEKEKVEYSNLGRVVFVYNHTKRP